jgi:hypothetical protein
MRSHGSRNMAHDTAQSIARTLTIGMGSAILLFGLTGSGPARAEVNVNINVGPPAVVVAPPPPVEVEAPPEMVYLPEPGVYVAIGIPFDVFFLSSRYYYFHGGNWFWASGYRGPWTHVVYKSLPPGLRRYKVERLHQFREREYKVYKVQGRKFKGKHFVAAPGPKVRHEVREHVKEKRRERKRK